MAACKHIGWDTIDGDGDHDDHGGDGDDHDGEVHLLLPCEAVWAWRPGVATLYFHFYHLQIKNMMIVMILIDCKFGKQNHDDSSVDAEGESLVTSTADNIGCRTPREQIEIRTLLCTIRWDPITWKSSKGVDIDQNEDFARHHQIGSNWLGTNWFLNAMQWLKITHNEINNKVKADVLVNLVKTENTLLRI